MVEKRETQCVNILKATDIQLQDFKQKIESAKGSLPVLVHPFFTDDKGDRSALPHCYTKEDYPGKRDQFLRMVLAQNRPCLLMINYNDAPNLQRRIDSLGGGTIYHLTTFPAGPQPLLEVSDLKYDIVTSNKIEEAEKLFKDRWNLLFLRLKSSGVRSVRIGGIYLSTYTSKVAWYMNYSDHMYTIREEKEKLIQANPFAARWLKRDLMPIRCAGDAACRFLLGGFDVSLSTIATPCGGLKYIPMELRPLMDDEDP